MNTRNNYKPLYQCVVCRHFTTTNINSWIIPPKDRAICKRCLHWLWVQPPKNKPYTLAEARELVKKQLPKWLKDIADKKNKRKNIRKLTEDILINLKEKQQLELKKCLLCGKTVVRYEPCCDTTEITREQLGSGVEL
jgi:hypothetical protein